MLQGLWLLALPAYVRGDAAARLNTDDADKWSTLAHYRSRELPSPFLEIKTQFSTREGIYKRINLAEYSKPIRIPYNTQPGASTPVRVSFVTIPDSSANDEKICFNVGRDLYVYPYKGIRKVGFMRLSVVKYGFSRHASDITRPVDKRMYKGTSPTCHDFNLSTASSDGVALLVGFSEGQIQLIDPIKKELSKLFNEERQIDRTKVTCLRWVPGSKNEFLVSHSSGYMYVYNEELPCGTAPPLYQVVKQGERLTVHSCKTKATRNPVYRWMIGDGNSGCVNEFAFSPCRKYLAVVSQDGFLQVFNFVSMELVGYARSYFGGLLCVCWSPDSRYVVTGGEDDLVTVWSLHEKRTVARGQGHRSWVSVVAFDPFTSLYEDVVSGGDQHCITCYRFGSIGQDTQLCLWDLTDDVLKQPAAKSRTSMIFGATGIPLTSSAVNHTDLSAVSQRLSAVTIDAKEPRKIEKRNFSFGRSSDKNAMKAGVDSSCNSQWIEDPVRLIGSPACPRLDECPLLEPLVCKKVSYERLTALVFKEDCFVVACQDGIISPWARPDRSICSMEML
ncbi:unnamed protein product [Notodromas monacha]|uniref:WD repeat-containing protein 20 n=1 Tax=Notodromas monacha TaxID=399045 RepID=A0A7R9BFF5_9CRUS|nr:unnamed protein product [Notodromas monacha]CAG0914426.1 unnamed protein product [Notodromas monacha]